MIIMKRIIFNNYVNSYFIFLGYKLVILVKNNNVLIICKISIIKWFCVEILNNYFFIIICKKIICFILFYN